MTDTEALLALIEEARLVSQWADAVDPVPDELRGELDDLGIHARDALASGQRLLAPTERERAGSLWESARQAIAPAQRLVIWADGGREGSSVPGLTWGQVTAPDGEDMVPIRTVMGKTFIEALEALAAQPDAPEAAS